MSFKPTLRTIMDSITTPDRRSPVANEITASAASRSTSGLRTARQSSLPIPGRSSLARTLGPYRSRRACASAALNPSERVSSFAYTCAAAMAADATTIGETRIAESLRWSEASQGLGRMAVIVLDSYFSRAVRKLNGKGLTSRNGTLRTIAALHNQVNQALSEHASNPAGRARHQWLTNRQQNRHDALGMQPVRLRRTLGHDRADRRRGMLR